MEPSQSGLYYGVKTCTRHQKTSFFGRTHHTHCSELNSPHQRGPAVMPFVVLTE